LATCSHEKRVHIGVVLLGQNFTIFQQRKWVFVGIFCFSSANLIHFVIKFLKIEIGGHDPSYGLGP
jgi:hypothetical protein